MKYVIAAGALAALGSFSSQASAQAIGYLGEVRPFGFNYCPQHWAHADGQLLSIVQHQALFSLYGTTFGGDGRTTFGVPDLRGRTIIHDGLGPGLTTRLQGQKFGLERTTEIAAHTHDVYVTSTPATEGTPANNVIAGVVLDSTGADVPGYTSGGASVALRSDTVSTEGVGGGVNNLMPTLAINYCVALQGVFPPRN